MNLSPSREQFRRLAADADLIPVSTELMADLETPVSAFLKTAAHHPCASLLESVEGAERLGRYSFIGCTPSAVAEVRGNLLTITRADGVVERHETNQPLALLTALVTDRRLPAGMELPPFCGGAVGYLSYDAVRYFERIPDRNPDDLGLPDALFMLTDRYLVFDRVRNRLTVAANAVVGDDPDGAYDRAAAAIAELVAQLEGPLPALPRPVAAPTGEITGSMTQEEYTEAVGRCLEHIRAGDILQAVLSVRFSTPFAADPLALYRALRVVNPSPYMFFLKLGDLHLVGSSPETMVKVSGRRVTINPIAGTRPRGATAAEDATLERDLLADAKEGAEHVMLVDLARNDLGRVALPGTVTVPSFRRVERFSHVMHLVSTVEAELPADLDLHGVIRAVFPAGTVSGAPKIRAMEIIDELEPVRRGPYAGMVGYLDHRGNMDTCITIRTAVIAGGMAHVQAGAGIVADSDPLREYQECRHKAEAVLRAVADAQGGAR